MRLMICIISIVTLAALSPAAAEQTVRISMFSGFEFESGDYGLDDDTVVESVPIGIQLGVGRLSLNTSISYLWSEGPAGAVSRHGGSGAAWRDLLAARFPPLSAGTPANFQADGWGDASVGAELRLTPQGPTYIGAAAGVTLPTGDETLGLGTGRTDWSFGGAAEQRLTETVALIGSAGYVFVGDAGEAAFLPEARDHAYGVLGVRKEFRSGLTLNADVALTQSSYDGIDGAGEASLSAGIPIGENLTLGIYGLAGFTETSPDIGAGVTLSLNTLFARLR